jgi:hypothetical protein
MEILLSEARKYPGGSYRDCHNHKNNTARLGVFRKFNEFSEHYTFLFRCYIRDYSRFGFSALLYIIQTLQNSIGKRKLSILEYFRGSGFCITEEMGIS